MADDKKTEEDKQSEMMSAFVEKMTPKLAETVLAQIDAKVEERLAGIAKKNDELLSKLHSEKRSTTDVEEQLAELKKQLDAGGTPTEIVLTQADARDVQKYRSAKKRAADADIPLRIETAASEKFEAAEGAITITRTNARDVRAYQEAKEHAAKVGQPLQIVDDE